MTKSKIQTIIDNTSFSDDTLVVENNFLDVINIVKNTFGFDTLSNITAKHNDKSIEIIYNLHSSEDNEDLTLLIHVSDKAYSITQIFPFAREFQDIISETFFVNFT